MYSENLHWVVTFPSLEVDTKLLCETQERFDEHAKAALPFECLCDKKAKAMKWLCATRKEACATTLQIGFSAGFQLSNCACGQVPN